MLFKSKIKQPFPFRLPKTRRLCISKNYNRSILKHIQASMITVESNKAITMENIKYFCSVIVNKIIDAELPIKIIHVTAYNFISKLHLRKIYFIYLSILDLDLPFLNKFSRKCEKFINKSEIREFSHLLISISRLILTFFYKNFLIFEFETSFSGNWTNKLSKKVKLNCAVCSEQCSEFHLNFLKFLFKAKHRASWIWYLYLLFSL